MTPQTVYVVDDDEAVRRSLGMLLKSGGFEPRLYASALQFLAEVDPAECGCLILDVRMPDIDGLALQETLNARRVRIPIILITGHGDVKMAVRAMRAGAADFLEKPFEGEQLLARVRECLERCVDRRREDEQRAEAIERLARLTPREREVVDGLVAGKQNKQIAADLDLSVRTVETHRAKIMERLGVKSLSEIVRLVLLTAPPG